MSVDDTARQSWQDSVTEAKIPPLDQVRAGANKFYRFVKWRNRIEYAACVLAVVVFSAYVFVLPQLLHKIGAALVVLGTFYAGWQLHRRASAVAPEIAGAMPILKSTRIQMARQRDFLHGIFRWYLLPFIPGLAVMLIGNGQDAAMSANVPIWMRWTALAAMAAVFVAIWALNQWAARRLQRKIDEIDALTG